jgi:flagellin
MSVINTNITSMIGQQNLAKSQNALQTSMERLSSGLRINSAKDDAAGQAIANRMSSQITGLATAQRNANDGISVAQTAEGALNQVNDNLQRIRELTVQAQNGTNSDSDLESIQNEIGQRLNEINRISEETSFNGVNVLAEDTKLQIQVGANDGEQISINLETITSSTLGLNGFNITDSISSESLKEVTSGDTVDTKQTADIQANGYTPAPGTAQLAAEGVYAYDDGVDSGYAVKGEDGKYYELAVNDNTGELTWDSASTAIDEGDVDTSKEVTSIDNTLSAPGTVDYPFGSTLSDGSTTVSGLYKRNDVAAEEISDPAVDKLTGYATKGDDGKFYEVEISVDTGAAGYDAGDSSTWTLQAEVVGTDDGDTETLANEVSAGNIVNPAAADTDIVIGQTAISSNDDLQNVALDGAPEATGNLYAKKDGTGYVVEASDSKFYTASVAADGKVSWDSSTAAVDASEVDVAGGDQNEVKTGTTTVTPSGLASGESLHQIMDSEGVGTGQYVVKGEDAKGNTTYVEATLDTTTGAVTKGDPVDDAVTVDALDTLDNALKSVDALRSDLGAIQNRFESAITNLSTTETNLSAARSRIEDADYAVEVANMTRAQILQQAGTSVLAQANQVPQGVLSLLG